MDLHNNSDKDPCIVSKQKNVIFLDINKRVEITKPKCEQSMRELTIISCCTLSYGAAILTY